MSTLRTASQTYVRLWVAPPSIDNSITVIAFRFQSAADASVFVSGASISSASNGTVVHPSDVPLANSTLTYKRLVLQGTPLQLYGSLFAVGRTVITVLMKTDELPHAALLNLALRQARRAEALGGSNAAASHVVLYAGAGALVLVMLVLFLVLRRAHTPRHAGSVPASVAGPRVGRQAGWYPNTDNPYELRHWDGEQWTARRVLEGGKWVEGPLP